VRRTRPATPSRRPTLSVVIPCYNYGHYLRGAVESALDQRWVDIDVTIIDDASPDGSASVALQIAAADERVRAIVHERNRGHIATYNEGLLAAEGDYIVLLSADDLLAPDALTRAVGLMEAHPSVGLCYGYSPQFETSPPTPRHRRRRHSVWGGDEWLLECARRGRNLISTPEVVMRTSVFRDIGGYDAEHPHAGDFLMWLRAAARSDVGRVNGADQAFYRVHGANMHLTQFAGLRVDFDQRRHAFDTFLDLDGHLLDDARRLREEWNRALAAEGITLAVDALDLRPPDLAAAAEFAEMSVEIQPALRRSRAYRTYQRLLAQNPAVEGGPRERVLRRVRRGARNLEWKWRWRRWRAVGL
jgi:glycosyltransferase involved in cell wall biosynthesis